VVYAINGITQAGAAVTVTFDLQPGPGSPVTASQPDQVPVSVSGLPEGVRVFAARDGLSLSAWDSTVVEQVLARGDALLLGLGVAVAAFLLVPVLRSVAAARPFDSGNASRIAGLAMVVLVVGWVGPMLSGLATLLVIGRVGLEGTATWSVTFGLMPLLLAALLLVLAEAFRRGELISREVEGLV
jgi:hypothetical protein